MTTDLNDKPTLNVGRVAIAIIVGIFAIWLVLRILRALIGIVKFGIVLAIIGVIVFAIANLLNSKSKNDPNSAGKKSKER